MNRGELKGKRLAVWHTAGMSFAKWEEAGILEREILIYQKMAEYFKEIYFFSYGDEEERSYEKLFPGNVKIYPGVGGVGWGKYYRKWRAADIIKTNQMKGALKAVLAAWWGGGKLVVRCGYEWLHLAEQDRYSFLKRAAIYWLEKLAYFRADKIVITSEEEKDYIASRFKEARDRIEVVPNYINTEKFKPMKEGAKRGRRIIYVGRLSKEKNLVRLLESLEESGAELTLVGDGPERENLKELAERMNVKANFYGKRRGEEIPKILNSHDFFVLPSLHEGNPKALLEAMGVGMVCVGGRVPGVERIIRDGKTGFLTGVTTEEMRKTWKKIFSEPEETLREIGHQARLQAVENYSLEAVMEKELRIYETL